MSTDKTLERREINRQVEEIILQSENQRQIANVIDDYHVNQKVREFLLKRFYSDPRVKNLPRGV